MIKSRYALIGSLVVITACMAAVGYKVATTEPAPKAYHKGSTLKG